MLLPLCLANRPDWPRSGMQLVAGFRPANLIDCGPVGNSTHMVATPSLTHNLTFWPDFFNILYWGILGALFVKTF